MSCVICGREQRGFGYALPPDFGRGEWGKMHRACSLACMLIAEHAVKNGDTLALTTHEREAVAASMAAVGAAIEATGTTDLATMTEAQFQSIIAAAFVETARHVRDLTERSLAPF